MQIHPHFRASSEEKWCKSGPDGVGYGGRRKEVAMSGEILHFLLFILIFSC
jgi:hypothetical protein